MPSDKQKTAWKLSGQRLQGYWDRVNERTTEQKINDIRYCQWLLVIVVIILSALIITK